MTALDLHATFCAICNTKDNASELYPANFGVEDFSPAVFSARRLPDRIHYRMVQCNSCSLVRSDPVADSAKIAELYHQSTFDYREEVENLAQTYGRYLTRLDRFGVDKGAILEIGCGNGFFLQHARKQGYRDVQGVEPSLAAIRQAPADIRDRIQCAMMDTGLFPQASFDVICFFQVLDHMLNPSRVLESCLEILKPGGLVLCLNHDVEAASARLMKDRSPIIDIEHTYLYSKKTIARLFSKCGFEVRETGSVSNRYSLGYLMRLLPLPQALKGSCSRILDRLGSKRLAFNVPLGNLYVIAQKPAEFGALV